MPEFFDDKPVERLNGEGIEASDLNQNLLGRSLDDVFDFDPTKLYSILSTHTVSQLGLSCSNVHIDTSSVHVDGEYNDINTPIIEYDGKIYHQVLRAEKTYISAAGKVSVERSLYRVEGPCICPLELQAGIIADYWTPSASRLGCYVSAHLSPYQGEKLFKEFAHLQP